MDITSIIGIIAGFVFVFYGIMDSGSIWNFVDIPSVIIVFGGTISAIFASFPLSILKNVGKHMVIICSSKKFRPEPVIDILAEFAQVARKDGLLALEGRVAELDDPFLRKSVMYVVDAMDPEKIRSTLELDIDKVGKQ